MKPMKITHYLYNSFIIESGEKKSLLIQVYYFSIFFD